MTLQIYKFYMNGATKEEPSLCIINENKCYFVWSLNCIEKETIEEYDIKNDQLIFVKDHFWPDKTRWTTEELTKFKPTSMFPVLLEMSIEHYSKIISENKRLEKINPKQLLTHHAKVLRDLIKEILKATENENL